MWKNILDSLCFDEECLYLRLIYIEKYRLVFFDL